jgi:hypothetical protein
VDILAKQIPSLPSATAENDFILSGPTPFSWVKKTLAQVISLLGLVLTQTAQAVGFTLSGGTSLKTLTVLQNVTLESSTALYPIDEITENPDDHTKAGLDLLDDADAAAQRTTLGLGTMATQAANSVAITGGTIMGMTLEAWPIHEIDELCSVD